MKNLYSLVTKIKKTEQEWRQLLTPEQYKICRQKGTEPAFTGKYYDHKGKGLYRCVCCNAPLFNSEQKFDSSTGWPSFTAPCNDENVASEVDMSFGMRRMEVHCNKCGSHLGHVFEDGPAPTNLRYCINSTSLEFDSKEEN